MCTVSYHVIFNPRSGAALASGITRDVLDGHLSAAGLTFTVDSDDDKPLQDRVRKALTGSADVIVAAGGDGTVLAVAQALVGSPKTLAVLPLGTMNALARELKLPLDPGEAIAALPLLEMRAIDVAEVNGQLFLHNVLIGSIPGIAVGREFMRGRSGLSAVVGFAHFMYRRLQRARRMALAIETDLHGPRVERLATLMIANNSYQEKIGAVMTRSRIDQGTLTAYLVRSLAPLDALRLAIEMVMGRWRDDEVIAYEASRTIRVRCKRKRILVTMDGEITWLNTPLVFLARPQVLSVLAPPQTEPVEGRDLELEGES